MTNIPPQSGRAASTNHAIFVLALAAFASAATSRICDALLPLLADDFSVTVGQAAIVVSAYAASYGLLQPAFGGLGDRFGKYLMVLASCLLTLAATFACAYAQSLNQLMIARLAAGAAAAGIVPLALAWIGDVVPYDQRQAALARYMTGQVLGLLGGLASGGVIAEHLGWRAAFMLIAAIYIFAIGGLAHQLRVNPLARQKSAGSGVSFGAAMRGILKSRFARDVLGAVFVEGALVFGVLAFVTAMLRTRFAISFSLAALILSAFGLGGLAYAFGVRRIIALLGEKGVALLGGGVLSLAYGLLAFTNALWLAPIGCFLIGLGFYALHNVLQVNATQLAPHARATGTGLFAASLFVGQALGAAAMAPVYDLFGATPIFIAAAVILPFLAWFVAARIAGRRADD